MVKRKYLRTVVAYKDYFKDFKKTVSQQVIDKFYEVFLYIMTLEVIPSSYFRSVEGVKGLLKSVLKKVAISTGCSAVLTMGTW